MDHATQKRSASENIAAVHFANAGSAGRHLTRKQRRKERGPLVFFCNNTAALFLIFLIFQ